MDLAVIQQEVYKIPRNPRSARDLPELIESCQTDYDKDWVKVELNRDMTLMILRGGLTTKAAQLMSYILENIQRRNFFMTTIKDLNDSISEYKRINKYIQELIDKCIIRVVGKDMSRRGDRLIEVHPKLAWRGHKGQQSDYVSEWWFNS